MELCEETNTCWLYRRAVLQEIWTGVERGLWGSVERVRILFAQVSVLFGLEAGYSSDG